MKFYAVRKGRQPGIYTTWPACEEQIKGFPGAIYKAFPTKAQALAFAGECLPDVTILPPLTSLPPLISLPPADVPPTTDGIHIWVDGSCLPTSHGRLHFGWAYVILDGERELHRASGHDVPAEARRHRNVAGEIQAVLQALEWCRAHDIATATISFDYQGLASWVEGTWKTRTPFTRAYAERVRALGMTLTWHKVLAHSGNPYNDLVDRLAGEAARSTPAQTRGNRQS